MSPTLSGRGKLSQTVATHVASRRRNALRSGQATINVPFRLVITLPAPNSPRTLEIRLASILTDGWRRLARFAASFGPDAHGGIPPRPLPPRAPADTDAPTETRAPATRPPPGIPAHRRIPCAGQETGNRRHRLLAQPQQILSGNVRGQRPGAQSRLASARSARRLAISRRIRQLVRPVRPRVRCCCGFQGAASGADRRPRQPRRPRAPAWTGWWRSIR